MAERSDDPFARRAAGDRPAAQPQQHRPARPVSEDDPLVELARIVSGQSTFDDIVNNRPASSSAPQSSRPRDVSFDLESELLNNPNGAYDPPPQPPARRTVPAPRATENFQHLKLRGGNAQDQWDNRTADQGYSDPYANADYDRGAYGRRDDHAATYEDDGYDEGYGTEEAGEGYDDSLAYDEDEGYDERPRRGRRTLVLLGLLGVLVLGGGIAAYALRGGNTGTSSSDGPPIIAADETPTKERPAAASETEEPQNKLIYDRVAAEESSEERLMIPEDEGIDDGPAPSDDESAGSREISRIILPGAPGDEATSPALAEPGATSADQARADSAQTEPAPPPGPRRVRTVIVRPDGTIISSDARPAEGDTTEPTPPSAPAASATPAQPVETARAPEIPAPAPTPTELAPPSTEPEPELALAPPAAEPAQPPPAQAEPAPAAPVSGGFVVQVSSQRSEDQARTAYRDLQRRYPSVLGNRAVDIARADLGDRGVYYRARVGPMGTREEAISLCEALKAAGGDCIVQRN